MGRRIVGAVLAVLLAAVGTFVLVLYVRGAEQRALAGEETVEVLVVSDPVARGTAVDDLAGVVRAEQVPMKVQARGSVGSVEELAEYEGQVTAVELLPGEQVTSARFIEPQDLSRAQVDVPDGLLEVTVSLSPERAIGGQMDPGSTVAVLSSFDPFDLEGAVSEEEEPEEAAGASKTPNTTHIILHKVLVTNVQRDDTGTTDDEDAGSRAPSGNLLVTLALDAPSIERVVFTAEHGRLWLATEPGDAPEEGTRIQQRGTIYR
jgi:pilus assembly protein CpaB